MESVAKFNRTYKIGDTVRVRFTPSYITNCTVKTLASVMANSHGEFRIKEIPNTIKIKDVIY